MQTDNKCGVSWGTVLFLLAILLFAGCSKEGSGTGNEKGGEAITFDCLASDLRETKSSAEEMQYFRVSAVWNKDGAGYEPFMNGQLVEKQNGIWGYSPVKQWPGYGSVNFFAYTPATPSGLDLFLISNDAEEVYLEYRVDADHRRQEDLMAAGCLGKTESPVELTFNHLLSNIKIQACSNEPNTTFRIKEIKFHNLYSQGTATGLQDGEAFVWEWYGQIIPIDYVVYQKYPFETQGASYQEVGSLMVLPQDLHGAFKISVLYDIVGVSENNLFERGLPNDFIFKKGTKYTFFLGLTQTKNAAISSGINLRLAEEPMP